MLSVKNPFIQNTPTVIKEATPKQTKYLISNDFFSFSTVLNLSFRYFTISLYFASSSSLQYTKWPGVISRKDGLFTE